MPFFRPTWKRAGRVLLPGSWPAGVGAYTGAARGRLGMGPGWGAVTVGGGCVGRRPGTVSSWRGRRGGRGPRRARAAWGRRPAGGGHRPGPGPGDPQQRSPNRAGEQQGNFMKKTAIRPWAEQGSTVPANSVPALATRPAALGTADGRNAASQIPQLSMKSVNFRCAVEPAAGKPAARQRPTSAARAATSAASPAGSGCRPGRCWFRSPGASGCSRSRPARRLRGPRPCPKWW